MNLTCLKSVVCALALLFACVGNASATDPVPAKSTVYVAVKFHKAPSADELKALPAHKERKEISSKHNVHVLKFETAFPPSTLTSLVSQAVSGPGLVVCNTTGGTITATDDLTGVTINFFRANSTTSVYKVIKPNKDWVQAVVYRADGKVHVVYNEYANSKSSEYQYFDDKENRRLTRTYNRDGSMDVLVHNDDGTRYTQKWYGGMTRMVYFGPESWVLKSTEITDNRNGSVRINFEAGLTGTTPAVIKNVQILNSDGSVKETLNESDYVKRIGKAVPAKLIGEYAPGDDLSIPRPRESTRDLLP
ncbi:MAG: hypothetical protein K2X93_13105 [Candidatus Obscuribacterales bacterium]|nr:hypothetical protein [Candidatus Obscuribacterales bacterium]